tara:strand:- start:17 stop:373 length:357 start_codon:yes stop_codon:yes gene_type:complete
MDNVNNEDITKLNVYHPSCGDKAVLQIQIALLTIALAKNPLPLPAPASAPPPAPPPSSVTRALVRMIDTLKEEEEKAKKFGVAKGTVSWLRGAVYMKQPLTILLQKRSEDSKKKQKET